MTTAVDTQKGKREWPEKSREVRLAS